MLNIANFTAEVRTVNPNIYYPEQTIVENIILDDKGKLKVNPKVQKLIQLAEETGNQSMADTLCKQNASHPQKNRSFHYLPYRTDSDFEQTSEFKIKCYKKSGNKWIYIGLYTPDFLVIPRYAENCRIQAEFNQKAFLNSSKKKPYKPIEITEEGLELIEYLSIDCTATEGEWHSNSEIKIDKYGYVIKDGAKTKDFWDSTIQCRKQPFRLKIRNICGNETIWIFE